MAEIAVSIIIPVFNAAKYLPECLDSILKQNFADYEVLCIDDGSTDDSPRILSGYSGSDARFRMIRQEHSNAGDARNRGIREAKGEYLLFLDADDIFEPDMLGTLYERCCREGSDICVCDADMFRTDNGKRIPWSLLDIQGLPEAPFSPGDIADAVFLFAGAVTWNKLYRRDLVMQLGLRYQSQPRANDLYFVYCMLALCGRISVVNRPYVHYRVGVASSLQANNNRNPDCFLRALQGVFAELNGRGLMPVYEKGFVNAAIRHIFYTLDSLTSKGAFERLYGILQKDGLIALGLDRVHAEQFEERAMRLRFRLITDSSKKRLLENRFFRRVGVGWCTLLDRGMANAVRKAVQKLRGR